MRRLAAMGLVAALMVSACSGADPVTTASPGSAGNIDLITIGSSETRAPALDYVQGLEYGRTQTLKVWEGEGEVLADGQPLLLNIYAESLEDGTVLLNTFDGLPTPYLLEPELIGHDLYEMLRRARVGSRILHVAPAVTSGTSTEPATAFVIDVLPVTAQGNAVEPREDLPRVTLLPNGEPIVTIPEGAQPPGTLQVATLIQGGGSQVRNGSEVLLNFKAVTWEDGEQFQSSWDPEVAPLEAQIGFGRVIQGLDQGLIDQTQGSQVLVVVPPALGYPDLGTLVFVVDILAVSNPDAS